MHPKQRRDTVIPVLPSSVYCILDQFSVREVGGRGWGEAAAWCDHIRGDEPAKCLVPLPGEGEVLLGAHCDVRTKAFRQSRVRLEIYVPHRSQLSRVIAGQESDQRVRFLRRPVARASAYAGKCRDGTGLKVTK